jgi:hypothetical protein
MMSPQQRIVQKMIDNIVENNKPVIEKGTTSSTPAATPTPAASTPALQTEDYSLISRKLEYGFTNLRQENADLRKEIGELAGMLKLLRNDMDSIRMAVQQRKPLAEHERAPAVNVPPTGMGAPQYKKTEADEHYERQSGQAAHEEAPQARGFAKKEPDMGVDIGKVFYYGKK